MLTQETLKELECPACRGAIDWREELAPSALGQANLQLVCQACAHSYPVIHGLPYFAPELGEQKRTAVSFGFEWKGFWNGMFDRGDVFGLDFDETADYFLRSLGVKASDLAGAKVLDAGTGSGRIPISIRAMGCRVYAIDIHESLPLISERMRDLDAVTFFQADLMRLPFKDGNFEFAWSSGVIMHSPDARKAFRSIASKVRPGGKFFVSVYGKDLHHYRLFRHLLPFAHRLSPTVNYVLSAILAVPLYLAFNGILALVRARKRRERPPYRVLGFSIENTRPKSFRSIVLNLFDQFHPRFQTEHSVQEVRAWFEENGFEDLVVTESTGGMTAVRGTRRAA